MGGGAGAQALVAGACRAPHQGRVQKACTRHSGTGVQEFVRSMQDYKITQGSSGQRLNGTDCLSRVRPLSFELRGASLPRLQTVASHSVLLKWMKNDSTVHH